jgi:hypothetical protein
VLLALTQTLTHVESFTAKIAAVQKHVPMPSPEFVKALDLSKSQLQIFPVVLLELKALESLDISFNKLQQLPYIELCALSRLVRLDCQGEHRALVLDAPVCDKNARPGIAGARRCTTMLNGQIWT